MEITVTISGDTHYGADTPCEIAGAGLSEGQTVRYTVTTDHDAGAWEVEAYSPLAAACDRALRACDYYDDPEDAAAAVGAEEPVTITVRLDDEVWTYLTTWADGVDVHPVPHHPMPLADADA